MATILSLECATGITSVAVHHTGTCVGEAGTHLPQAASSQLMPLVDQAMHAAGIHRSDLQAVAVSAGPGSYTGLRIGVATAKGICYALGLPLLAVSTLEILVQEMLARKDQDPCHFCPMIDARRMEVYCNVYNHAGREVMPVGARIIDSSSFHEFLQQGPVYFFGDGSAKCQAVLQHPNARFVPNISPQARHMGALAWRQWQQNLFCNLAEFEPLYLKDFIAKKPNPRL
jgi:tRNA threonylcarbamoyladenosine biosynthesis protein TsaB